MTIFVIKIISIFGFVFSFDVFADKGPTTVYYNLLPPPIKTYIDTNKAGMIRTKKIVRKDAKDMLTFEVGTTIHDKKGNLMFLRYHKYKDGLIVQTIENDGVVRDVISSDTRCDFAVIESSKDSVYFHLNPKEEPKRPPSISDDSLAFFKYLKVPNKDKYDAIIFNRWTYGCQYTTGFW